MKKIITFALMFLMLFSLTSCKKDEGKKDDNKDDNNQQETVRTYVADGEYTAYSYDKTATKPEVTTVTVTIKNDKITNVNIDTRQGSVKDNVAAFDAQSKKEKGYNYHMHGQFQLSEEDYKAWLKENNKLEWFEQIALVEAEIVKNGTAGVTVTEGKFTNIAGVTVGAYDYMELANKAIQMAKDGVKQSVIAREDDLVVATAKVSKDGKFSDVKIDEICGSLKDGVWSWSAPKQETGYNYHMHGQFQLSEEDYKAWLKENNKLEWVDQVKLICEAWVANNSVSYDSIASVTIGNHDYLAVLNLLKK